MHCDILIVTSSCPSFNSGLEKPLHQSDSRGTEEPFSIDSLPRIAHQFLVRNDVKLRVFSTRI